MHRITLTAGPRTTRPDQILSCCFFCRFSDDLVVTQGIEIMLVPTAQSRSVSACQRRLFTEVNLDRADAKLQQTSDLVQVPLHSFRIAEIERRILGRKLSAVIVDVVPARDNLFPQFVLAREIRILP